MTLERKDETASAPEEKCAASGGKKPVIVYILVLFLVAFSLMALSLLVHQRSNAEAMGRLQSSVSAMQEVQELQNRVIQLQEELAETQKSLASAQEEEAAQAELAAEAQEASSLTGLTRCMISTPYSSSICSGTLRAAGRPFRPWRTAAWWNFCQTAAPRTSPVPPFGISS